MVFVKIKEALPYLKPDVPIDLTGYVKVEDMTEQFECNGFSLQFDGEYGGLIDLKYKGRQWANQDSPFARMRYTTYDETDFTYLICFLFLPTIFFEFYYYYYFFFFYFFFFF